MNPFYGWGAAALWLQSHYEKAVYLYFATYFPGISGTHLTDFRRMKG